MVLPDFSPPPRVRSAKLASPADCAKELAKLYRETKIGNIDSARAARCAGILTQLATVLRGDEPGNGSKKARKAFEMPLDDPE